jgi:4-hydroxybenzoate polyprenyltransferase
VSLRSYLRLMRIPNVFTAFANVVAGVCLSRGGAFHARDLAVVLASGSLYCAGMVWNDYYDRDIDAAERPERPIPAGEVTPTAAAAVGGVLLGMGLALCAWHGFLPVVMAGLLTGAIMLYDATLKHTRLGPLSMGMCRALNVLLGMSVDPSGLRWWAPLPVVLGVFTLLITRLSEFEVSGTAPERLQGTLRALIGLGGLMVIACLSLAWFSGATPLSWLLLFALIAFVIDRGRKLFEPLHAHVTPPVLGRAIGGGILLMPAIDASFVAATGAPLAAAAVFGLTAPAWLLKRWYYLT